MYACVHVCGFVSETVVYQLDVLGHYSVGVASLCGETFDHIVVYEITEDWFIQLDVSLV